MYLVSPIIGEVDLGGVTASHGDCSRLWNRELSEKLASERSRLIEGLRQSGIDLVHLDNRVVHRAKEPETVISAPQRSDHFRDLMRNIGIDDDRFIRDAWLEVKKSRGEAIHAGFEEQEVINERLLEILIENEGLVKKAIDEDGLWAIPDKYGKRIYAFILLGRWNMVSMFRIVN